MGTPEFFNRAIEAVVYPDGQVRMLSEVRLPEARRAIVMIFNESPPEIPTATDPPGSRLLVAPTLDEHNIRWAHYRIIKQIAAGGMGITYQAQDERNGRVVCLKRLHAGISKTSLQQECRSLARLDSPQIVRLLEFDVEPETPYLVMEYIDGSTLAQHMHPQRPWPESLIRPLAKDLFEAIAYAHDRAVIHCDLKPGNILIPGHGADETLSLVTPKIIDFGLAVVDREDDQGAITAEGRFAGTPAYMAPEQMQRRRLSGACDVYALGIIIWELFTGVRAFSGSNVYAILAAKVEQKEGLTLNGHFPSASSSLAELVAQCTHPDVERRPTAREALSRLAEAAKTPWWKVW